MSTLHVPVRPTWRCACCWEDWPCHSRRARLLAEFTGAPVSLGLLMAANFAQAAGDLPAVPAGELHRRFLGWVRHQPPPAANRGRWR